MDSWYLSRDMTCGRQRSSLCFGVLRPKVTNHGIYLVKPRAPIFLFSVMVIYFLCLCCILSLRVDSIVSVGLVIRINIFLK